MLFAIDIGNTNIVFAIIKENELKESWRVTTHPTRTADEYTVLIDALFQNKKVKKENIDSVVISSVVPNIQHVFVDISENMLNKTPKIVSTELSTGLSIKLDNPKEIGADLIATAVGAKDLFPDEDMIVLDCGTATKLTIITKKGEFLGGIIAPGLETSAKSLTKATAALPQVALKFPTKIIGTNTIDAIASGQMYGYVGLIKELVTRLKAHYPEKMFKVVATGGYMHILQSELDMIDYVDAHLIFRGLNKLDKMNR